MSLQTENLNKHIQSAFADVESAEFLKTQIAKGRIRLSESFVEYMKKYPESNFREWSEKFIAQHNINTTVPSELQAIGISLLALDDLEHEITNTYVKSKDEARHT